MPRLDNIKERIALLKWFLGVIVAILIAVAGWVLNKFEINENILITLALLFIFALSIVFVLILKKINALINEVDRLKK